MSLTEQYKVSEDTVVSFVQRCDNMGPTVSLWVKQLISSLVTEINYSTATPENRRLLRMRAVELLLQSDLSGYNSAMLAGLCWNACENGIPAVSATPDVI